MEERDFRPAVVVNGEDVVYAASSLGSCVRALAAARQELEPYTGPLPDNIAGTFQRGHEAEEKGVKWFEDRGWVVLDRQREVVLPLTKRIRVVGHVDYLVQREPVFGPGVTQTIVDAKRQNDEEFAKGSIRDSWLWDKYAWQFSCYMLALGIPLVVQRISDAGDVKLETIVEPPKTWADVLRRVLEVETTAAKDLRTVECVKVDYPCPYWKVLHDREEKDVEEVEDEEVANWALHYNALGVDLDEMQARRKELRKLLVERVGTGRHVRDKDSRIEIKVTEYPVKERVIPAGKQTRLTVRLPE